MSAADASVGPDVPPLFANVSWSHALSVVFAMLPGLREAVAGPPHSGILDPGYLIRFAQDKAVPHELTVIREHRGRVIRPGSWEWYADGLETEAFLDLMFSPTQRATLQGTAIFVDDCGKLPHYLPNAAAIESFLTWHEEQVWHFFDGDVVMLFPDCGLVSLYHHAGAIAHLHSSSIASTTRRPE